MARNYFTALDVGTSTVQAVVAEEQKGGGLRILGMGIAPSAGVRRGVVVDLEEASSAIRQAVDEARRSAGVPVRSVWVGVGGSDISVSSSRGVVAVSRADGEISPEEVRRSINAAETFIAKNPNKEILHVIPRDFKVDHEAGIKDPIGMHGVRLEADTLIVECSSSFLKNLLKSVEQTGLKVEDYVFSPLASSEAVLTKRQKELGVMLVDLGGGTASFIIYEEGMPIHAGVVPIGGNHITNDVAIGFRTHVDIAEQIKVAHGSCLPGDLPKRENIRLAEYIPEETGIFSRKELAEIVEARLKDIFELLHKELKKVDRVQLLPAGIVIVGGSAAIPGLIELARKEMKLPVEIGRSNIFGTTDDELVPSLSPVLGVAHWAYSRRDPGKSVWASSASSTGTSNLTRWLKSLLP